MTARAATLDSVVRAAPEIDSTSVTLRLFGDELEPEQITAKLGSEPTLARRKNEVTRDANMERTARTGRWLLSGARQSKSSLEFQIRGLFERLTDDVEVWRSLCDTYQVDLFCGLWSEAWNRGLDLSPEVLGMIADRHLRLAFDIYFVPDEA